MLLGMAEQGDAPKGSEDRQARRAGAFRSSLATMRWWQY